MPAPSLAFLDMLGSSELLVIFLLVLVFFGGEKMPEFARGLGKAIREFRKAASGVEQEFRKALEEDANTTRTGTPTPSILPPSVPGTPASAPEGFRASVTPVTATPVVPGRAAEPVATTPVEPLPSVSPAPASAPAPVAPPASSTPERPVDGDDHVG